MRFAACLILMLLVLPDAMRGQAGPAVSREQLPPSAILSDELTFFERIRADMANWSDVELSAFNATTSKAKADCSRIEQTPHEGEEALALARLCALGWDWDGTYSAARWYTRKSAPQGQAAHLAIGFALLLKADLSLQAVARSLEDLKEMHERIPFDADTDSVFTYTINALEVMRPDDGVAAARMRQRVLLDAVAGKGASVSAGQAEAEAWHFLALLHAVGQSDEEKSERALLLGAIAARTVPLSTADQYTAQRGHDAYEWLGKEAPIIEVPRSTYLPGVTKRAPAATTATLLVIEMADAADAPALSLAMDSFRTHLQPGTEAKLVLIGPVPASSKRMANLQPIHADYTQDPLLATFNMESGPGLVLLGSDHRVRWIGTVTAAWLNPQQQAEILLSRIASEQNEAK